MSLMDSFMDKVANDFDIKKEKELIEKVQQNPNDFLTWKQLRIIFRGVVKDAVAAANIVASNINEDIIEDEGWKHFKDAVMGYDVKKGTKPSTHITNHVSKKVKQLQYEHMNKTRFQADLARKSQHVFNAEQSIMARPGFEGEPTFEQIYDEVTNGLGKNITMHDISKIKRYTRQEHSLDNLVGEQGTGEDITVGDVLNNDSTSIDAILEDERTAFKLQQALSRMDIIDRELIEEYHSIGKFKGRKQPSFSQLALNNNLSSPYEAQKRYNAAIKILGTELMK